MTTTTAILAGRCFWGVQDLIRALPGVESTRVGYTGGQNDHPTYRSAIFHLDDDQKRIAFDTIADGDASGLWPAAVVTEVTPDSDFWETEPEHQDYLQRYPGGYTCHYVCPDWKLSSRRGSGGTARTAVESTCNE